MVYLWTVGQDIGVNACCQPLPPVDPDELVPGHVPREPLADHVRCRVGGAARLSRTRINCRCTYRVVAVGAGTGGGAGATDT